MYTILCSFISLDLKHNGCVGSDVEKTLQQKVNSDMSLQVHRYVPVIIVNCHLIGFIRFYSLNTFFTVESLSYKITWLISIHKKSCHCVFKKA